MNRLVLALAALAPASAFVAPAAQSATVKVQETKADLEALAVELNPIVGFYDPLGLADAEFWDTTNEETIGFLRQAEIKHGRVAMAGFVGYCLHANGVQFPLHIPGDYTTKNPGELWDQVPTEGKLQILGFIAFLEFFGELGSRTNEGAPHYMRGGKPGAYPSFKDNFDKLSFPHPVPLDLYDPFGLFKNKSEEAKERGRLVEINNGRLAMIGLFGFLAESVVPGSVPFLTQFNLPQYTGNVMVPFEGQFSLLS